MSSVMSFNFIPNVSTSKSYSKLPLIIKSAARSERQRPKSSSGGGVKINSIPRSGLLMKLRKEIRSNFVESNNKSKPTSDAEEATILKFEPADDQ